MPDLPDDIVSQLYSVAPDEFMDRRGQLVDAARRAGDSAAANSIAKLRKPTVAAWIVNALVLEDPSIVDTLTDLGERLHAAQDALDAEQLRELSAERRKIVDKLCADAFRKAGRNDPPAALRDEVNGTFDAAIADADVAARLGTLTRAEQWSGFGFLPTGTPQLTVVRGGRDDAATKSTPPSKPRPTAAEQRKLARALADAQKDFERAESAFGEAQETERDLTHEVRRLTKQLAKMQTRLDEARGELEQARKDTLTARAARRDARSALDRAEREAGN